jgi:hypothetical protein
MQTIDDQSKTLVQAQISAKHALLLGAAILVLLAGLISIAIGLFYALYYALPPMRLDIREYLQDLGLPTNHIAGVGTALFFGIAQVTLAIWAIPRIKDGVTDESR